MKQLTKQQVEQIIAQLQEAPAKYVYNVIRLLQSLPDAENQDEKIKELENDLLAYRVKVDNNAAKEMKSKGMKAKK